MTAGLLGSLPGSRAIVGLLLVLASVDVAYAKQMTEKERMRAQAEHLCYNDVQKLCNDAIPDEAKIQACMRAHRTQLSSGCRKVFEASMK